MTQWFPYLDSAPGDIQSWKRHSFRNLTGWSHRFQRPRAKGNLTQLDVLLWAEFQELSTPGWFERHQGISPEDFFRETHRNSTQACLAVLPTWYITMARRFSQGQLRTGFGCHRSNATSIPCMSLEFAGSDEIWIATIAPRARRHGTNWARGLKLSTGCWRTFTTGLYSELARQLRVQRRGNPRQTHTEATVT